MKISVVVPAFNEQKLLGASLAQIKSAARAFEDRGWEFELVVCDNNSTDATAAIAREHGARVVFEAVNQIGRARNTGAWIATGDWLIFVDADSHPSQGLFGEVAESIRSGKILAGGATVQSDKTGLPGELIMGLWNWTSRTMKYMAGSFIFVEAAAFRSLGGFSHKLYAGEELELSKRLKRLARRQGRRIVILSRFPLVTSARKLSLYTPRELLGFFLRAILNQRVMLTSPEKAHLWYDGRR